MACAAAGPAAIADNSPAASHATLRTEQNMTSSRLILLEAYRPDAGPRNLPWRTRQLQKRWPHLARPLQEMAWHEEDCTPLALAPDLHEHEICRITEGLRALA